MTNPPAAEPRPLPLAGIRVVELVHMVMGPACGLFLADLGADVIKVEPVAGDNTRRLAGAGVGFFPMLNRNKRSLALDLKHELGREVMSRLLATTDVLAENFRPGAMARFGLDPAAVAEAHPRLVYCSLKGFLPGPYEHRAALDEVVQMMSGLAYMTGPSGQPLRVGASVVDIMGGMAAVIAILAALRERDATGEGQHVQSALYESAVMLMGQHMVQGELSGRPVPPMSERAPAWGIYDVFNTRDSRQVFIGVVTDTQWRQFCEAFERHNLLADPTLATNNQRVAVRKRLLPMVQKLFVQYTKAELIDICEQIGLPYAPISRPEDLHRDPHLDESGGLLTIGLPDGREVRVPALPISLRGERPVARMNPPAIGEHSVALLEELGYDGAEIEALVAGGQIAALDGEQASQADGGGTSG